MIPVNRPNLFSHLGAYFGTTSGAWDFFRIGDYAASVCRFLPLSQERREYASHLGRTMNRTGNFLSIPKAITDAAQFKESLQQLNKAYHISASDPARDNAIASAYKRAFIEGGSCINNALQGLLLSHDLSLLSLGKYAAPVNGMYNATGVFNDGLELVDESFKLNCYKLQRPGTEQEKIELAEKKNLSWMKITKDILSLIGSALTITAIFYTTFNTPVVAALSLGLCAMWLTMKIASNLYERIIAERGMQRQII